VIVKKNKYPRAKLVFCNYTAVLVPRHISAPGRNKSLLHSPDHLGKKLLHRLWRDKLKLHGAPHFPRCAVAWARSLESGQLGTVTTA